MATEYEIKSGLGVGPIVFGMTRDEVRKIMKDVDTLRSFRRSPSSIYETDAFSRVGINACYGGDFPRVNFIETMPCKEISFIYNNINVFQTKVDDLLGELEKIADLDRNHRELGYLFVFPSLGLRLWRPSIPEDADDIEAHYFRSIGVQPINK